MIGQIIKVKKSFCEVKVDNQILSCVVRGNVKKLHLVVGDFVDIDKDGAICKLQERKSYFIRPNCSNVDVVNIVIATLPKPRETLFFTPINNSCCVYLLQFVFHTFNVFLPMLHCYTS